MTVHPALERAATAARSAAKRAALRHDRLALLEAVAEGADGTPTSRLDRIVEDAILAAIDGLSINVLSEEVGFVDRGSAETLVIDPVDGTGNLASGIPVACFTGAVARDGVVVEGLTEWLATGERWWARPGVAHPRRSTGATSLSASIVSTIRPKGDCQGWLAVARRCTRIRILGSSSFEAALVCTGRLDAFVDAGSDTHRIVDLVAAIALAHGTGAVVRDLHGRPFEIGTDVSIRWSGVVAATAQLADEIIDTVLAAQPLDELLAHPS